MLAPTLLHTSELPKRKKVRKVETFLLEKPDVNLFSTVVFEEAAAWTKTKTFLSKTERREEKKGRQIFDIKEWK